ncbi:MAG: hypothetical protein H0T15_00455 [Thermoleophilaceae bacterium]|nr:hypothetical protein [Thermoleophilaceae bacterium]
MGVEREESDQLPEEAPSEQVVEDDGPGEVREGTGDSPGVPGADDQQTGNPGNAGDQDG